MYRRTNFWASSTPSPAASHTGPVNHHHWAFLTDSAFHAPEILVCLAWFRGFCLVRASGQANQNPTLTLARAGGCSGMLQARPTPSSAGSGGASTKQRLTSKLSPIQPANKPTKPSFLEEISRNFEIDRLP